MKLRRLAIQQLPGLGALDVDDFAPGMNFIVGPNAIGKSSLIRALQSVLVAPEDAAAEAISVTAWFDDDDGHWRVDRTGAVIVWQRNGQPMAPPALPPAALRHCYWLNAEHLLVPDATDQAALARTIRQALAGGIDMGALRETAGLQTVPYPRATQSQLDSARNTRRAQEAAYRQLEEERARLPEQRQALNEARQARDEAAHLRAAIELARTRDEVRRLRARLDAFPAAIRQMSGAEGEMADKLSAERDAAQADWQSARAERLQIEEDLRQTGLADELPDTGQLDGARRLLQQLAEAEQQHAMQDEATACAAARVSEALADLGADTTAVPRLTPGAVETIEDALANRSAAQARLAAANGEQRALPDRIMQALAATALAGGGTAFATGLINPRPLVLIAAAVAGLAGLAQLLRLHWRGARRHSALRAAAQADAAAADAQLAELLAAHALHPDALNGQGIGRLLRVTQRLDEARDAHAAAAAEMARSEARIEQLRDALGKLLAPWAVATDGARVALQAEVDELSQRADRARHLHHRRVSAERRESEAENALKAAQDALQAHYARLGLAAEARSALDQALTEHAEYSALAEEERALAQRVHAQQAPLKDRPDLLARAQPDALDLLSDELSRLDSQAAEADGLQAKIADLEARLNLAGSDNALREAMAREQQLERKLVASLEQHLAQRLGNWLLNDVEATYQVHHEPALIADARQRFERFTRHQWSLATDQHGDLLAVDLERNERRELSALSSGTRMQLLLAARIAWLRDQESDTAALPLALDEALGSSDPQRFRAAADSLQELVTSEDRQILYLTARPEDLTLWQSAGEAPVTVIDLAARRDNQAFSGPPGVPPEPASVPQPTGYSDVEYGAVLQVPGIDPRQSADRIHCFHLLRDDLEALYTLISDWGITRLGPAARWLESAAGRAIAAQAEWPQRLRDRIRVARRWTELARIGRGRPLDADVITASDTQTETMARRITAQLPAVDHDAAALIARLREGAVPKLQRARVDRLEQWLVDAGYLDERPRLDEDAITTQLVGEFGHHDGAAAVRRLSRWLQAALPADLEPMT